MIVTTGSGLDIHRQRKCARLQQCTLLMDERKHASNLLASCRFMYNEDMWL